MAKAYILLKTLTARHPMQHLSRRRDLTKFTVVASQSATLPTATFDLQEDDQDAVIPLEDSSEDLEPSQKRARLGSHASAGPSNSCDSPQMEAKRHIHDKGGEAWIPPFSLLKVQGIPSYGNRSAPFCLSSFLGCSHFNG